MPPRYKLKYLDYRMRGELARLLFTFAGVPFEDYRFPFEDWAKEKKDVPLGHVPVLYIDDVIYSESVGITNYLAREFGLYGKTSLDMLVIDEVVGVTQDIWRVLVDLFHAGVPFLAKDDTSQQEKLKKLNEEKYFPMYVGKLEKLLKEKGTGFFCGNEITYADMAAFDSVDLLVPKSIVDKCPLLKANMEIVKSHPKLKDYIAARKECAW